MRYYKNKNAALDAEFAAAPTFGNIKLGEKTIFYRKIVAWYTQPIDEIARAYRRVEEIKAKTGCCSNDFSIHKLILTLKDGTEQTIKIGEALYRHEPEMLMEEMKNRHPEIAIGKAE